MRAIVQKLRLLPVLGGLSGTFVSLCLIVLLNQNPGHPNAVELLVGGIFYGIIGVVVGSFFKVAINFLKFTTLSFVLAVILSGILSHLLIESNADQFDWHLLLFLWVFWGIVGLISQGVPKTTGFDALFKQPRGVLRTLIMALAFYVFLFFVFFDTSQTVSLGQPSIFFSRYSGNGSIYAPRPRLFFPSWDAQQYTGREPAFLVFYPFCQIFVWLHSGNLR